MITAQATKEILATSKSIDMEKLAATYGTLKGLKFSFDGKLFEVYNVTNLLHCCELKKDLTRKSCHSKHLANYQSEWFYFGVETGAMDIIK
jgi:hypothetical protein